MLLPVVCRQLLTFHIFDFSSETPGPNLFKLHVEPCVKGELKIYTNGHGP